MRQKLHANPSMLLPQFNAHEMYKQNSTSQYQKALNPAQRQKLCAITRAQDESGANRDKKIKQAVHMENVQKEKLARDMVRQEKERQARNAMANAAVILDISELERRLALMARAEGYLTISEIDLQLDWLLQYDPEGIPKAKSSRGNRDAKCQHLKEAVVRYNSRQSAQAIQNDKEDIEGSNTGFFESSTNGGSNHLEVDDSYDSEAEYYQR